MSIFDPSAGGAFIGLETTAGDGSFTVGSGKNPGSATIAIGTSSGSADGPDTPAAQASLDQAELAAAAAAAKAKKAGAAVKKAKKKLKKAEKSGSAKKLKKAKKGLKKAKARKKKAGSSLSAAEAAVSAASAALDASRDYECELGATTVDLPDAPALDNPELDFTNMPTYTVSGTADPGIALVVRRSNATATTNTDQGDGTFSVAIALDLNTSNGLEVLGRNGPFEGPPVTLSVIHDNVAPAAPTGVSSTSGSCLGGIPTAGTTSGGPGSVEGNAQVRIQNITRTTETTTTAAANGSFSAALHACSGDVMRITAIDAAGNVSPATEIAAS